MFKFNFAAEPEGKHKEETEQNAEPLMVAEEVPAEEARYLGLQDVVKVAEGITLLKGQVSNAQAASLLGQQQVADSDLLPGQYEGGFKVWEGSVDLAEFVARQWGLSTAEAGSLHADAVDGGSGSTAAAPEALAQWLAGQRVIELGCGHALPGLVALMAGAAVDFQDYNREVLQTVTIPNVAANWAAWQFRSGGAAPAAAPAAAGAAEPAAADAQATGPGHTNSSGGNASGSGSGSSGPPAHYFCGDWGSLGEVLAARGLAGGYDVVLSAETIYSLESMRSLFHCIKQCLKRPSGVAYVAAKSYYFGVGGGTAAFLRLVNEEGEMVAEVVQVLDDGLSNKREIMKLSFAS